MGSGCPGPTCQIDQGQADQGWAGWGGGASGDGLTGPTPDWGGRADWGWGWLWRGVVGQPAPPPNGVGKG